MSTRKQSVPPARIPSAGVGEGREIWAVGSGKGGTGKTFLSSNIGITLAKMGKKVILMDADLGCANLHTGLGMSLVSGTLSDFLTGRVNTLDGVVVDTPYPNLRLISGAHDFLEVANPTFSRKEALLSALKRLDFDYLVFDLGAGTHYNTLDFFLAADKSILMVMPEPTAVENAYRFIKSAYFRYLKRVSTTLNIRRLVEEGMDLKNDRGIRTVHELLEMIGASDPEMGRRLREALLSMRPHLVVNQVRSLEDVTLGFAMRSSVEKYFGMRMDYVGYIEYDDVVWKSARQRRPVVAEYPYSSPARCVDRVVRNLMAGTQLDLEAVMGKR
ncbi:MAG: AAA family ATPase [Nitrospirota bacterium]|nr:AAA family ATPase [Nitrospirota bacterium]